MSEQDRVLELERRRCDAISAGDLAALGDCLAADYLHIFGGGRAADRAGYIDTIRESPRAPERGSLRVRLYGDVAVLTGDLLNRVRQPDGTEKAIDAFATQVAVRQGGIWRFVSFQITKKAA